MMPRDEDSDYSSERSVQIDTITGYDPGDSDDTFPGRLSSDSGLTPITSSEGLHSPTESEGDDEDPQDYWAFLQSGKKTSLEMKKSGSIKLNKSVPLKVPEIELPQND